MIVYVDTSALLKLVLVETESRAARTWIAGSHDTLVGSQLLRTEAHCGARRRAQTYVAAVVDAAVAQVSVVPLAADDLIRAAAGPEALRASGAVHLATALRLGVDAMMVYDAELSAAAASSGLQVIAPR